MLLKKERLTCPTCKEKLSFKQYYGMRVKVDNMLEARCDNCEVYYKMPSNNKD